MNNRQLDLQIRVPSGITADYPDFHDLVAGTVWDFPGGIKKIASETYHDPQLLRRMLNRHPDDMRHLPLADLPTIIRETGDTRPVFWLIETFLMDVQDDNLNELQALAAELLQKIEAAEAGSVKQ